MNMICLGYKQRIRGNSTCDADSSDSLWTRILSEADHSGDHPKCRYEVLVSKAEARAAGVSEDVWSREVKFTDPITQTEVVTREDYKYAVSSAESLDIVPVWGRATDGHDVDIPLEVMSYVKDSRRTIQDLL